MTETEATTYNDPFLCPRDPGEVDAAIVIRETLLRERPPEMVFRQTGKDEGYALIVPRMRGARLLTVPGLNESDFMFHGDTDTSVRELAAFVVNTIGASRADHLRLPLLTKAQAERLRNELTKKLPNWILDIGLSSVSPIACGVQRVSEGLRRAIKQVKKAGMFLETTAVFPAKEIRAIHELRWGQNRNDAFYKMLAALLNEKCAELVTVRLPDGKLVAAQLDILGNHTRHFYYGVSEDIAFSRVGAAALGICLKRFVESGSQHTYSFGRGSECYKYQFANAVEELYELRGFFAPVSRRMVKG